MFFSDEFWTDTRNSSTVGGLIAPSITPLPSAPSCKSCIWFKQAEKKIKKKKLRLIFINRFKFEIDRIGTMRQDTYEVVDYEQRRVLLKEANRNSKYEVDLEYTYSSAYGQNDATPSSLNALRAALIANETLGGEFLSRFFAGYNDGLYSTGKIFFFFFITCTNILFLAKK